MSTATVEAQLLLKEEQICLSTFQDNQLIGYAYVSLNEPMPPADFFRMLEEQDAIIGFSWHVYKGIIEHSPTFIYQIREVFGLEDFEVSELIRNAIVSAVKDFNKRPHLKLVWSQ